MLQCREEVLAFTKQLVAIKSIVNSDGEKNIAHELYSIIASFDYFSEHKEKLTLQQTINDEYKRYNVLAYVKGTKETSNRTVILMGHIDTVGVDEFNHQKDQAFSPDEWKETLKKEDLPHDIKRHLHSDDWMFGRGVLDMKSGVASHLYLLKYFSEHPEELSGNIVFIGECDEENNSNGILSAIKLLRKWKEEHAFSYVAAINSDFVAPRFKGDENRYIYKGTAGKLLPSFFITGTETHVGACFEGLDPNFIAAELTKQLSYNTNLCDVSSGEVPAPPVALKQTDLKPAYSAQTALSAYVYYNFFVQSWSPEKVLGLLKAEAITAFQNALHTFNNQHEKFCELRNEPYTKIDYKPRVLLYEELENHLISTHGTVFSEHMQTFKESLLEDSNLDTRMFSVRVVEEAWKWMKNKTPAIVLFYSSLYSPRIDVSEKTQEGQTLLKALDQAVEKMQPVYEKPIITKNYFPYISDMSFVALSDDEREIEAVTKNNPGWGTKHFVSYEDVREIDAPVINIGPYGMDAHKKLERTELTYSLEIVPNLTYSIIKEVLK